MESQSSHTVDASSAFLGDAASSSSKEGRSQESELKGKRGGRKQSPRFKFAYDAIMSDMYVSNATLTATAKSVSGIKLDPTIISEARRAVFKELGLPRVPAGMPLKAFFAKYKNRINQVPHASQRKKSNKKVQIKSKKKNLAEMSTPLAAIRTFVKLLDAAGITSVFLGKENGKWDVRIERVVQTKTVEVVKV